MKNPLLHHAKRKNVMQSAFDLQAQVSSKAPLPRALLLLPLLMLFLLIPRPGQAAQVSDAYLSITECTDGEMPAQSIIWYQYKKKYYFFLPGGVDYSRIRLWLPGRDTPVTIDDAEYNSGDQLPFLTGPCEFTIKAGSKSYPVVVMQGSAIGAIFIQTESGNMNYVHKNKANKEAGTLYFLNADGTCAYVGGMEHIKMRGNTAPTLKKKNYGFKLEKGASFMGMEKAKRWVLLGSYRDRSQLRNQIVYNMAKYVGLTYTPDVMPVDLYLNGSYYGTYLLAEKIEINDGRVEINDLKKETQALNELKLSEYTQIGTKGSGKKGQYKCYDIPNDPADITGGYIIEYENWSERYKTEVCAYRTLQGKTLLVKDPDIVSEAQMQYISEFMQSFENAIFSEDGYDPDTGKPYWEIVDFDSLVLKYMLEEVSMNCDGNASSQYYYKPADEQSITAYAGPAWDYDTCFGDFARSNNKKLLNPAKFLHNTQTSSDYWWPELYKFGEFQQGISRAWNEKYAHAMSILLGEEKDEGGTLLSVDEYAENLRASANMNFIRWPMLTFTADSENVARTGYTYDDNITYLKNFISSRRDFLQTQWGSIEADENTLERLELIEEWESIR